MTPLRVLCIGAGYFSHFHLNGWSRIPVAQLVGLCDLDLEKANRRAAAFPAVRTYTDFETAIDESRPDIVDIITRPETHLDLVTRAATRRLPIICQKPLAPDFLTAVKIVETAERANVPLMVHENFRFQPWHREIKRLLKSGAIGDKLHSLAFRSRMGDGWDADAYLSRQPYFRQMPRLLIFETGVHFIDTFRFLGGEINEVYAILRRLNSVIAGEDTGLMICRFREGAVATWDANRFNESTASDPRFTMGEFLVEGNGGSVRMYADGRLTIQALGGRETEHAYPINRQGFSGDCVHATLSHFVDQLRSGDVFETSGHEYLKTLAVQEAVYQSASENRPVRVPTVDELAISFRALDEKGK